jgi:hypothetical protein
LKVVADDGNLRFTDVTDPEMLLRIIQSVTDRHRLKLSAARKLGKAAWWR